MGKIDVAAGDYLADAAVFADTFNFFLYDGKEVIRKEQLSEMNPASLHIAAGRTRRKDRRV